MKPRRHSDDHLEEFDVPVVQNFVLLIAQLGLQTVTQELTAVQKIKIAKAYRDHNIGIPEEIRNML